jgi:hypothetical protein
MNGPSRLVVNLATVIMVAALAIDFFWVIRVALHAE